MNSVLQQLLSLRQIEYLVVDRELKILETSLGAKKFADCPQEVKPTKPVCLGFPELVGVEEVLIAILEGRRDSFELKGIGRFSPQGHPLYLDLYVLKPQNLQDLGNRLVIFIENVTEKMILEQKLVQRSNEVSLLLEAWDSSNEYLNKIIQSLANALLVTTRSGIIKMVNQSANNLFGYSTEELMGTRLSKLIIQSNLLLETSQKYFLVQKFSSEVEVAGLTKQGTEVAIAFSCSAIQTHRDNIPDYIYVGREISKRQ